jgi:hypothetical protein
MLTGFDKTILKEPPKGKIKFGKTYETKASIQICKI